MTVIIEDLDCDVSHVPLESSNRPKASYLGYDYLIPTECLSVLKENSRREFILFITTMEEMDKLKCEGSLKLRWESEEMPRFALVERLDATGEGALRYFDHHYNCWVQLSISGDNVILKAQQ